MEDFIGMRIVLTVLAVFLVKILYQFLLEPFLRLRTYRTIPGAMITYNIGSKKVWEYTNSTEKPIELNNQTPFLATEINVLLLKYPDLKVMVTNIFKTPVISVIDHHLNAEIIKNPDIYLHFLKNTMLGRRYSNYSLIFAKGDAFKRQRKIISKAFAFESMQKIIPIIQEVAKELYDKETYTNRKELIVLKSIFLTYTWEAFSRSFFGDNLKSYSVNGQSFSASLNKLIKDEFDILLNPQYHIFGEKAAWWNSYIRNHKKKVDEFGRAGEQILEDVTSKIRRGETKNEDGRKGILELILETSPEDDDTLSNSELIGNFFSFSFPGTDTTANTISNLLYCVEIYPEVKKKTLEDIESHWDGVSAFTLEALNKMEYLHALILETLRVMSPAPFTLPRIAGDDHMIGNIPIKKGSIVQGLFSPTVFSPRWIRNPDLFQPERWIKGHEAHQQLDDMHIFIPFSFGPRTCIGQHFGMTQMKIALCYFLTRFDFSLPPDFKLPPMVRRATMEPKELVKMYIKPRKKLII